MKVFVGGLTPRGEQLLHRYLDEFMPDAIIEPLKSSGIKGKIKNHAGHSDVVLVIIDESLYEECKSVAGDILAMPKVHKYVDDAGLNEFLISKFGKLSDDVVVPPTDDFVGGVEIEGTLDTADYVDFSSEVLTPDTSDDSRIKELEAELAQSQMLVRNLTKQLKDGSDDVGVQEYIQRIKSLKEELNELHEQYNKLESENYINIGKANKADSVLDELRGAKEELRKSKESYAQLEFEKSSLESTISDYEEQLETLKPLEGMDVEVDKLRKKIGVLQERVDVAEGQYNTIKEGNDSMQDALSTAETRCVTLKAEKRTLELEIETLRGKASDTTELKETIGVLTAGNEAMKNQLSDVESALEEKTASYLDLQTKNKELEKQLADSLNNTDLQEELDAKEVEYTNLDEEWSQRYTTLERKYEQIHTQYETLKEDTSADELRVRVEELEKELASRTQVSETDVTDLRNKCTDLELELASKDEELKEIEDSVFMQLMNSSLPKVVMNAFVPININGLNSKFTVVCGGTSGCNDTIYKVLNTSCNKVKGTVLILDLSSDTSIDVEFSVSGIKTPISWLSGSATVNDFIRGTSFTNVSVISVGLAYLNNLYLLDVDWERCLRDLDGLADHIVINVGYLTTMVSKILFQSFKKVMKGNVIVKATPINIRATMLSLIGLADTSNMSVYCAEFHNASESFYKKLASKYKTNLLNSSSVMEI